MIFAYDNWSFSSYFIIKVLGPGKIKKSAVLSLHCMRVRNLFFPHSSSISSSELKKILSTKIKFYWLDQDTQNSEKTVNEETKFRWSLLQDHAWHPPEAKTRGVICRSITSRGSCLWVKWEVWTVLLEGITIKQIHWITPK